MQIWVLLGLKGWSKIDRHNVNGRRERKEWDAYRLYCLRVISILHQTEDNNLFKLFDKF